MSGTMKPGPGPSDLRHKYSAPHLINTAASTTATGHQGLLIKCGLIETIFYVTYIDYIIIIFIFMYIFIIIFIFMYIKIKTIINKNNNRYIFLSF